MARAGICTQCGTNVWLTPEGGCPSGHGPECITGEYEVRDDAASKPSDSLFADEQPTRIHEPFPQQPVPLPPPDQKSRRGCIIIGVIAALLALCVCGVISAIAVGSFGTAREDAKKRSCFANERIMDGAIQIYYVDHSKFPKDLAELVPELMPSVPTCPSGGTYEYSVEKEAVSCSVHGDYRQQPN